MGRLPKRDLIDMDIEIAGQLCRVVAYWVKKEKQSTFLVTNLSRHKLTATAIGPLYRLRWQVELLFKACKSYHNLRGFQTANASLQGSLIWASLIVTTLKRFMTGCIEAIFNVAMSTMVVSKTTMIGWLNIVSAILKKQRKGLLNAINDAFSFLSQNATRTHPKRDRVTGVFQ